MIPEGTKYWLDPAVNTTTDLDLTFHMGKYSCIKSFYFIHINLNLMIYYTGILCFASRVIPQAKFAHAFLGRVYITCMCLSTAAAMLIHNTGLGLGVLVLFIWVLGGMILGWFIIKLHQNQMLNSALELVDVWLKSNELGSRSIPAAVIDARDAISRGKTWKQRFFSYKAVHGFLMTLSWFNIAGRVWATKIDDEFTCYTYPVYKPVNASIYRTKGMNLQDLPIQLVPNYDNEKAPLWKRLPGQELGWMTMLFLFPLFVCILIGTIYSCVAAKREGGAGTPKQVEEDKGLPLTDLNIGG